MSLSDHKDVNATINRMHDGRATARELKSLLNTSDAEPGFAEDLMEDFGPDVIHDIEDEIERLEPPTIFETIVRTLFGRAA